MSEFHGSGSLGSFTLSRPSIGSWHHKKSNLYKETLLGVAQSLKINADDFNAAADAVVAHQQTEVIASCSLLPLFDANITANLLFLQHVTNVPHVHGPPCLQRMYACRSRGMCFSQQTLEGPTAGFHYGKQTSKLMWCMTKFSPRYSLSACWLLHQCIRWNSVLFVALILWSHCMVSSRSMCCSCYRKAVA